MDMKEYQQIDAINATSICAGRKSMLHMHHVMTGADDRDTPAMAWGRKVHAAILEPDRFFDGLAIWDGAVKRGKAWDAFKADADTDLIVTRDEMASLQMMQRIVWSKPDAAKLLGDCETEQSYTWEAHYGKGKCRADATAEGIVVDYKTTAQIEPDAFFRTAFNLGYHIKMGWYAHGIEKATGTRPKVYLIVQEASAPWDCWVCQMPSKIVKDGEKEAVEIAVKYAVAAHEKRFRGVADGVIEYMLPAWATGGEEALPNMEGI